MNLPTLYGCSASGAHGTVACRLSYGREIDIRKVEREARNRAPPLPFIILGGLFASMPTAAFSSENTTADQELKTITVVATGVSNMNAASAGDVSQQQIMSEPLLRPAAILENVPGLIATQHPGVPRTVRARFQYQF
jgi:hypothetical protein